MSFYDSLVASAKKLIASKGRGMTLRRETQATYDPNTGSAVPSPATSTDFAVTGVSIDFPARAIDGTIILRGDIRVTLSPDGEAPQVGDLLIFGSKTHRIVNVQTLSPAGTVLLYELQVRAGA